MKEYQKPSLTIDEVKVDDILSISVNQGMFDLNMNENGIGGFDEIW